MATNRLFIYDPETHTAACIAKGYISGWATGGGNDDLNAFFDGAVEFTGGFSGNNNTRLQLKTEDNLPDGCIVSGWKYK